MSELYNNSVTLLKKINFTLLILTSVIVLFTFLATRPKLEKAIDDLEDLENAFKRDSSALNTFDYQWLDNIARDTLTQRKKDIRKSYYLKREDKYYRLNVASYQLEYLGQSFYEFSTNPSLLNIKALWDGLHGFRSIKYIENILGYIAEYNKETEKIEFRKWDISTKLEEGFYTPTAPLNFAGVHDNQWIDYYYKEYRDISTVREKLIQMTHKPNVSASYYVFGKLAYTSQFAYDFRAPGSFAVQTDEWKDYDYSIVEKALLGNIYVPIHVNEIPFSPLRYVIMDAPEDFKWKYGNFRLNFKELDDLTQGYQDLPMSKIKVILERELDRAVESVNLFGVNIPYDLIKEFGVLAMLLVQVYFLIYLNYLVKNVYDPQQQLEIPWMLLHDDLFSKVIFVMSSLVYPLVVTIFILITNLIGAQTVIDYMINISLLFAELITTLFLTTVVLKAWRIKWS